LVAGGLLIGGVVGVVLSGGFLYWEVGKFATPQVPRTLFDERRLVFAYTIGIFAGIPIAFPLAFLIDSMSHGYLISGFLEIAAFVFVTELAQWLLLRATYFGAGPAKAFYAIAFRAGISLVLILTIIQAAVTATVVDLPALGLLAVQSFALLLLCVSGALMSLRTGPGGGRPRGGPLPGALFGGIGLFLISLGWFFGPYLGIAASALAIAGAAVVYLRLRAAVLGRITPPVLVVEETGPTSPPPPPYGRIQP